MEILKTHQNINFLLDGILDLITDSVLGALEVIPGVTVVVHEGEEVVIQPDQLEVLALHIGNFHVVCGGTDILKLLSCKQNIQSCLHPNIANIANIAIIAKEPTSEDVKGDKMDLGVAVLPRLRGRHLNNLARPVLSGLRLALEKTRIKKIKLILKKVDTKRLPFRLKDKRTG